MKLTNKYTTLLLSVSVFVLFFSYYFITSNALPHGAGPDWKSNTDVSKFIFEHGRLAVLPDDEESLHFTVYGGTRALRPPLSYIVSAAMAGLLSTTSQVSHTLFRKGSALLCALAVALGFYALSIHFSSYGIGILGAALIGLMPQFTFIASYNNDDSGAIFSATLMLAVLIRIYRYGVSNTNAVLIGLAAGLVILSKMTAWLLMPFVILFLLFFVRAPLRNLLRYTAIAGVVFILSGGWWFAFNVYHYGIDDPLQKKITNTVIEQHRRLPPDAGVGFTAQGIGFYELIIQNHKNFLGETAKATIGNLDWLKLKVGPLQYTVYKAIFFFALFYYFFNLTTYQLKRLRGDLLDENQGRQLVFETLLIFIILFQILMYTWTNIYNDIQIQGKYLIPVFLAALVLFFSGLERLPWAITSLSGRSEKGISVHTPANRRLTIVSAGLLFIVYMHWHAMVNYVIPFYKPPAYDVRLGQFHSLPLDSSLHQEANNLTMREIEGGIEYTATGPDPKVTLSKIMCRMITGTAMLRLEIYSNTADTLQFFVDEGNGYTARNSFTTKYKQGSNTLLLPISADQCQRVRFDPFVGNGPLTLKSLQIATMVIHPRRD
jgi:4-amino-4-deoxy-L-arabinose transferase-like glycosyltransferase